MGKRKRYRVRLHLLGIAIFSFFLMSLVSLVRLQVLQYEYYRVKASRQRNRIIKLSPKRGTIYDRNMKELAISTDVKSLFAHPNSLSISGKKLTKVAKILGINRKSLAKKLRSKRSFVWIKRHLSPTEEKQIRALDIEGLDFIEESKRIYPKRFLAGHTLGFAGVDNKGLEGIELGEDKALRGSEGWYFCYRDARNRAILTPQRWIKAPTQGSNIVLTLDEVIQYFAEKELNTICLAERAKSGCVVVMEPDTGDILALATYPPFNPNNFHDSSPSTWRNRCVVDVFEPGSTMKPLIFATAFDTAAIKPGAEYDCRKGYITVGDHRIYDWKKFGVLSDEEGLAYSSNSCTIQIAQKIDPHKFYRYLLAFGLGEKTGIRFPGEAAGIFHPLNRWTEMSMPSMSIGYEISVTALQLVSAYAAIANNGILMRPRLIKSYRDRKGQLMKVNPPQQVARVISPSTARLMKKYLHNVVAWGTGEKAAVTAFDACGKTGTAKLYDHRLKRYTSKRIRASFIGFVPRKKPIVTIGVFIEEPRVHGWGSSTAAPVFANIAEQILRYKRAVPTTVLTVKVNSLKDWFSQIQTKRVPLTAYAR